MADESVEFEIELKDGVSGPAKRMSKALRKISEDAERTQTRMMQKISRASVKSTKMRLGKEYAAAKQSAVIARRSAQIREAEGTAWTKLGGSISTFAGGVGMAAGALAAMGVGAGGVVYGAGKLGGALIDSAKSAGDLKFALGQLTHTDGRKELEEITRVGTALGLGAEDAAHSYANLLKQGFSPPDAKKWIRFGADMQSLGSTADEVNGLLVQMSQMKGKGKVEQSDLRVMADNGLNLGYVREALAEKLGKTVPEIMKMQEAGQITADMGFEAIEKAILRKMNTSRAGEAAEKYVQSFSGSMKRGEAELGRVGLGLGAAFERGFAERTARADELKGFGLSGIQTQAGVGGFFEQMQNSPALEKIGGFVERLGDGFAVLLPHILAVGEAFVSGFADGSWTETFGDEDFFTGFAAILRDDVAPAMRTVGKAIGWTSSLVLTLTGGLVYLGAKWTNMWTGIYDTTAGLVTSFTDLGSRVIDGFVGALTGGIQRTKDAVVGWAESVIGGGEKGLEVHSPSKAFYRLGKYSTQGFQEGMEYTTPQLPSADSMVPNSLGAGGGSPISMQIDIHIDGSKDPAETARMVRIEFETMAASMFGRFAEGIA